MQAALPIASGVVGAVGSYAAGQSSAATLRSNAQADQFSGLANFIMLEKAKAVAREQAANEAWTKEQNTKQTVASAEAGMMQNNIDLGGSNLAVINQLKDVGKLDAMMSIYNGDMKAFDIGVRQSMTLAGVVQAGVTGEANARSAIRAGIISGASKFLSGSADAFAGSKTSGRLSVSDQLTV